MPQNHLSLESSYYKTILVIQSCNTKDQLNSATEMVKNFKSMYKQVGFPKSLSYSLDRELSKQKENIWK